MNTAGIHHLKRQKVTGGKAAILLSFKDEILELIQEHRFIEAEMILAQAPCSERQRCLFVQKFMPWLSTSYMATD
jgi:hypothetical protein